MYKCFVCMLIIFPERSKESSDTQIFSIVYVLKIQSGAQIASLPLSTLLRNVTFRQKNVLPVIQKYTYSTYSST